MICLDLKSYSADGSKVSDATLMEVLLMNDFKLVINNTTYSVSAPIKGKSHALIALTIWLNVVKGMRSLRQLEPLWRKKKNQFCTIGWSCFQGCRSGERTTKGRFLKCFVMINAFSSDKLSSEHATEMEDIKSLVHRLFVALHLEDHQIKKERELLQKLDHLKEQLMPLEQVGREGGCFCCCCFVFKCKSISSHQE